MGRKKGTAQINRTKRLHIRLTPAEQTQLLARTAQRNETISDWVRRSLLNSKPMIKKADPMRTAYIKGLGELGKIGSNVNQIAHELHLIRNHFGEVSSLETEISRARTAIQQLSDQLHKILSGDH